MKRSFLLMLAMFGLLAMTQGCAIGYNSLLFVTKSNVGFEVDTQPPTAELAISRTEGVVEPTFENGKTLPVMASFRPEGRGLFSGSVEQTFATGQAAAVMASLYGDETVTITPGANETWDEAVEKKYGGVLTLDDPPELPSDLTFLTKKVRPVFFGTSTSLGVKVSWSGMTAAFPDSLHVGFRRKELAWAPVAVSTENTKTKVRTPSLLATISLEGSAKTPNDTSLTWLQYFATGRAATALALRKEVRQAMIKRLDPTATFASIPLVDPMVEEPLLPLTAKFAALDPNDTQDAQTIAKFNAAAVAQGYTDFEDLVVSSPTLLQVQAVRGSLEADGVQFD